LAFDEPLGVGSVSYLEAAAGSVSYLEAAAGSGHKLNDDYNGERQDGFARMQMTIRNGRRESAATAYLRPAPGRKNLAVTVRAHVARVIFEGMRSVGVEFFKDGVLRVARAEREVIVSAGAINSPQILMLSGSCVVEKSKTLL
jgi:4-pyridoxate dehydrogenase